MDRAPEGEPYGLAGPLGLGTVTPYAGLGLAGGDSRSLRAGARTEPAGGDVGPEHGVGLRVTARW